MNTSLQIDLKAARVFLPMTHTLTKIIQKILVMNSPHLPKESVTINFHDPSYSVDAGGFHPVEIRLQYSQATSMWQVCYITDFAYHGGYFPELTKDIDFNFTDGSGYQAYVGFHPLGHFRGLYRLWEANFREYLIDDTYQITIRWD